MTATICINDGHEFDLTRGELADVAGALRAHTGAAEARVMREVFWPMDEGGLDCLLVDQLDPREFALFAGVVQRAHAQATRGERADLPLWERLQIAVNDDARRLRA